MRALTIPEKILAHINRKYPSVWKEIDRIRSERGTTFIDWPQEVFLPYGLTLGCLTPLLFNTQHPDLEQIGELNKLDAIAAWRPGQDIVRFDKDVYNAIITTPLTGNFPVEVLWRQPAWAIYFETPGLDLINSTWDGFISYLDITSSTKRQIRLFFVADDPANGLAGRDIGFVLELGDWSIEEALRQNVERTKAMMNEHGISVPHFPEFEAFEAIKTALNLVLYICSYGFNDVQRPALEKVSYPAEKKVKGGWRLFPPAKPRVHYLGEKIGEEIRKVGAEKESPSSGSHGSHASPRPHIRRAHWHGYWSGPKKGDAKREFNTRWLPPIPVALGQEGNEEQD